MPRIDPAYPPIWRSTSILQFGLPAVASLEYPLAWQLRLIRALESGVSNEVLDAQCASAGAPPGGVEQLLTRIAPALVAYREVRPVLRVLATPEITRLQYEITAEALRYDGFTVIEADSTAPSPRGDDIVVVLGCHVIEPRLVASYMADDVAHLPIALKGTGAVIGPLVRPGRTACLTCVAHHACDGDQDWPVLAAQLASRAAKTIEPGIVREAAGAAGRLILADAHAPTSGETISVRADSPIRELNAYPPHAECGCRSLAGNAMAADLAALAPRSAPTYAMRA